MNTTERIVESYFRLCLNCFTYADVKVASGNNRQLDLLATNLREDSQYHVETSVTHELSWRAKWSAMQAHFERKFFGAPMPREGAKTDYTRGRNYFEEIKKTYRQLGFAPNKVHRIWVTWVIPEDEDYAKLLSRYCRTKRLGKYPIQVLSFRDTVLPELLTKVRKSNYSDDALRTLSLLKQFKSQRRALRGDELDF